MSWSFEHIENHPANTTEHRCELCGVPNGEAAQGAALVIPADMVVRRIAELDLEDPFGTRLMLRRTILPQASHQQLAESLGCSRQKVTSKITDLGKHWPELRTFLGLNSPKSRAQRRRQARANSHA